MCWAFDSCPGSDDPETHSHCCACGESIPAKLPSGEKQWACVPECSEAKDLREMNNPGPVSYCCICGGMGGPDGRKCWGCQ